MQTDTMETMTEPADPSDVGLTLVVDDQPAVAATVAKWLEKEGMACHVAHSGCAALEMAEATEYGLVFADVHMPGESGLDLARELKDRDPSIQVVIITGSTHLQTAVEALRLDADDYLLKPFDPAALLHSARRARKHRQLILENQDYRRSLEDRVRQQSRRLERLYLSSILALVKALEAKDPHTRGHSDRVASYALALADRIGGVDRDSLEVGGQLHDIGKIGVRGGLLRKNGPLELPELEHVQTHPVVGVDILTPLLDDPVILEIVRYHHERWDGAGYPDGLAGEEIPLPARIVAVADTFDAMTTSRPYRSARTHAQALAEIEAEAGRQFDPEIARIAAEVLSRPAARVS
ncbi:MAG: response regulator [Longimicrobiales bacterium]|nr:response regulator [Longimicrobiales bacterium]